MPFKLVALKPFALILFFFSATANAHLLKVFAYTQMSADMQSMTTSGKVYFAGGAGVAQLKLDIIDSQNKVVETLKSDHEGKFNVILKSGHYQLQANTQDGHLAKWSIKPPKSSTLKVSASTSAIEQTTNSDIDHAQMQQMLAEIVSSQIQPLSEQINALQERAKVQDIIGALGYIFGLYGLAMWWRHRKPEPVENEQ